MKQAIIHLTLEEKDLECHVDYSYDETLGEFEFAVHQIDVNYIDWKLERAVENATWLREICFEEIKKLCLEVYEEEKSGYL